MTGGSLFDIASLPLSILGRIDSVCQRFETAWKADQIPLIEEYLGDGGGAERAMLFRELLLLDLEYRRRLDVHRLRTEYQTRFPQERLLVESVFEQTGTRVATHNATPRANVTVADQWSLPTIFGDYQLLDEIGRGGMGVVYRARQISLDRDVALKMILPSRLADETAVKRFRTEAQAAANLRHANIVGVYEVGVTFGQHYFSMDLVEGRSLADLVRDQPLPNHQAAKYLQKIAEAVHYLHQQRTLHRDLKPANVLIDIDDEPRLTDFGLAKRFESDSDITGTHEILGTPSYMSPEQARGKHQRIGTASDIFSLGSILYELLTGRPAFRAATPVATLRRVIDDTPVPVRLMNPRVPQDVEKICLKCLEKEPSMRYGSAKQLANDLQRFLRGSAD